MGWLEGLLTGYADRHYEIEKQKREEAGLAAEREGQVLNALLSAKDPQVKAMAAAGILDLANPRKKARGLAGWMGEMQQSPYLGMIKKYGLEPDDSAAADAGAGLPTPSIPTAGSVPPPTQPPGALPETSLVTGGPTIQPTPPPRMSEGFMGPGQPGLATGVGPGAGAPAAPQAAAPPSPPGDWPIGSATAAAAAADPRFRYPQPAIPPPSLQSSAPGPGLAAGVFAAGQPGAPPQPPAGPPLPVASTPPPNPGEVSGGLPGATTRGVGGVPPPRPQRTRLATMFPTTADKQREQAQAAITGKVDGYAAMYMAQGFPEQEAYRKAADLLERDLTSSGGLGMSYAEGNVQQDATSPTGWSQILYLRSDPTKQMKLPAQPPNTPEYLAQKREAVNQVNASAPTSTSQRNTIIGQEQARWNAINAPMRLMELNLRNMESAYTRYKAGDRSAWEALRTAFVHVAEPNSVVMPSEFARAAGVLSFKDTIWGWIGKQVEGGAPLPDNVIEELVRQADAMWKGVETYGAQQKGAIASYLDDIPIPHEYVFGPEDARFSPTWGRAGAPSGTGGGGTGVATGGGTAGGGGTGGGAAQGINNEIELGPDGKYRLKQP